MSNARVNIFGRIKPCKDKNQSQIFEVNFGKNGDTIQFSSPKVYVGRKTFKFQKIFPEETSQEEVFNEVARPIIKKVLSGYNGTIFTYGQTGSGKTYTMTGDVEGKTEPGLIQRTIQELFYLKSEGTTAAIGYYEIYNEQIYDLIKVVEPIPQIPGNATEEEITQLLYQSKHNNNRVNSFRNLTYPIVNTADEATQLFLRGDANRVVAETAINARSSRSHVIFSITLDIPHPSQDKLRLKPILYLIDLAGSEKMPRGQDSFNHFSETRFINLSLYYLEQVLMALRQPKRIHIPYRNSLMTAHLKNSLGGNCVTSMIATLSVTEDDIEETMHTCRFAERLSQIKNDIKLNEITENQKEIAELKRENEKLKAQIKMISQKDSDQLTEREKDRCVEMVQNYIQYNDSYYLPLSDPRLMRHCFWVMRKELLERPTTYSSENFSGLGSLTNTISRSKTEINITKTTEMKATNFMQKKRSIYMSLPKVNITYETLDYDAKHTTSDGVVEKKVFLKKNLENNKKSKTNLDLLKINKSCEEKSIKNRENEMGEKENSRKSSKSRLKDLTLFASKVNSNLDMDECNKQEQQEPTPEENKQQLPEIFSTSALPLTGDDEVDEEIIKFYKARYEAFKKTDE